MNITNLRNKLINGKWLLDAKNYSTLCSIVETYIENPHINKYTEQEFKVGNICEVDLKDNATAIIPICGILVKGCSEEEEQAFGLENTDEVKYRIEDAMYDESIKDILLIVNSPGGETLGIAELGRYIKECNNTKPIYAWTENIACSAAYWLVSQCKLIGMTPSAMVGSIGVYSLVENLTKAMEKEGIAVQSFSAGKYKLMGHNFRELTEDEKNIIQSDVNKQHEQFKQVVLESRPSVPMEVMEGLTYEGQEALDNNLVDIVVDDIAEYLSTPELENISMRLIKSNKNIKSSEVLKVAASPEDKKNEVKPEVKQPEDVVKVSVEITPGVPEDKKSEETKCEETETQPEEQDKENMVEQCVCPHCGKNTKDIPIKSEEKKKCSEDEDEDDKPVDSDPVKEPVKENEVKENEVKENEVKENEVKDVEPVKEDENKKQSEANKSEAKKATFDMSATAWNEARGIKSYESTNEFVKLTYKMLENFRDSSK